MAGVRKKPTKSGKYQGWFVDAAGKQRFFTGTRSKTATQHLAERLEDEHRQVRLGYRPAPQAADKQRHRSVEEVKGEYMAWGESQGGRGGRPWGKTHLRMRQSLLGWWQNKLGLITLADLDGILPRVEEELRDLQRQGRAGKTLANYAEALGAFCDWCVQRRYLASDPLKALAPFDTTPTTTRRALSGEEIGRLLEVCVPHRKLLMETAFLSGLRAHELRSLAVDDLDVDGCGVRLHAEWTKNRKDGFQPIPTNLIGRLHDLPTQGKQRRSMPVTNAETRLSSCRQTPCSTSHHIQRAHWTKT